MGKNKRLPNDIVLAALQLVRGQNSAADDRKQDVHQSPYLSPRLPTRPTPAPSMKMLSRTPASNASIISVHPPLDDPPAINHKGVNSVPLGVAVTFVHVALNAPLR